MPEEPDDLSPAELETEGDLMPDREVMSVIAPVEDPGFTIQPIEESNEASILPIEE
jgi:hypothetical protein